MRCAWLAVLACAACVRPGSFACKDGGTCPTGTVCAEVTDPDESLCVPPDQLAICAGKPRYTRCGSESRCYDGVCLPATCGNGRVDRADPADPSDAGEVCDDGNQTSGDGCSSDCRSDETCGNGVLDPIKGEVCDDGNHIQHDGCDSRCLPESPRWVNIPLAGPSSRQSIEMAYDVKRDRTVMFGGFDTATGTFFGDTWEWNGGWVLAAPVLAPAPRAAYALAYDAARSRTVLFGGANGQQVYDDTWEWDGTVWTPVSTPVAPQPRTDAAMVYDSARHRIVLFGGLAHTPSGDKAVADTWEWDGATWTSITTQHVPGARHGAAIAYDPTRAATVMFSGAGTTGSETWEYFTDKSSGAMDWRLVSTGMGPADRVDGRMAYDSFSQSVVLFGGREAATLVDDQWSWNGAMWQSLGNGLPTPRADFGMAANPAISAITVFGGQVGLSDTTTYTRGGMGLWSGMTPVVPAPISTLHQVGASYDARLETLVLLDYESGAKTYLYQRGSSWVSANPGAAPTAMMTYDPLHAVTVVYDESKANNTFTFDGQNGQTWQAIAATAPPLRGGGAMGWDGVTGQVLLFGGAATAGELADTWAWNGASWAQLAPAHHPTARDGASIAFDPIRRELVLFGGFDGTGSLADTWVWDGSDWSQRMPAVSPPARSGAALTWFASRQRLALFGGGSLGTDEHDLWEWDGVTWSAVTVPNPPPGRTVPIVFPTPDGTALLVFGGLAGPSGRIVDMWRVRWEGQSPDESCVEDVDADGDGLAGCQDPDCWSECTPLCPPGTTCDPSEPHCGDGVCVKQAEGCRLCTVDCMCRTGCGDSYCDPGEDHTSCPGDCP